MVLLLIRTDIERKTKQIGVIAQEVEKVLPEVVSQSADVDEDGEENGEYTKTVAYGNMNGLLIEAIKELTSKLNTLEERLDRLEGKE